MKVASTFKKRDCFLILAIIIYPLLWVCQGIGFLDTGFSIFWYKQIFNHNGFIWGTAPTILTSIIGGLWIKIFPFMEYTSCKLGYAVIILLINFLMFQTLKDVFKNKTLLLLTLLLSTICMIRLDVYFLNYSSLTVLFFIAGSYFLYSGIINKSKSKIFISSIFFSLNIFVRCANILGLLFVFAPFIWTFLNFLQNKDKIKEALKNSLKFSIIFLSGYILTAIVFLLCLKITGFSDFYFKDMQNLFTATVYPDSHHSSVYLLNLYINTYFKSLLLSIIVIGLFSISYGLIKSKIWSFISFIFFVLLLFYTNVLITPGFFKGISLILVPIVSFVIMFVYKSSFYWTWFGYFLFPGIFLFIPFWILVDKKADNKLKLLCFLGILTALFSLAGSGWYFFPGYWFLTAISIYYILNLENFKDISLNKFSKFKKIGLSIIIFLSIFSIITRNSGLGDYTGIKYLNTTINNNMFQGSYTSKERAAVINDFIKIYPNYIKETDSLLALPNIPLMHYITNAKPALDTSWPLCLDYRIFNKKLDKIEKNKQFPVILISKYNNNHEGWPKSLILNPFDNVKDCSIYSNSDPQLRDQCEQKKAVERFISRNKYDIVWENSVFIMYKKPNL
ncbi:MAG: hypothetical protein A2039_06360 [Candidatus Melainabacteria bacterium GWA2_34_9]|nr:MAG: hypothetical protein A2039_06360 [Candidatus Melainabacteria bacterium GWA2_34_9]